MGVKRFTVTHQRKDCIGCGLCAMIAPQNWSMNDQDGLADLKDAVAKGNIFVGEVEADDLELNQEAAAHCPVQIIGVEEDK